MGLINNVKDENIEEYEILRLIMENLPAILYFIFKYVANNLTLSHRTRTFRKQFLIFITIEDLRQIINSYNSDVNLIGYLPPQIYLIN